MTTLTAKTILAASVFTALGLGTSIQGAMAQTNADAGTQLGAVHFETSCNETAQRRFDRAMRFQHSFWYRASAEVFEEALKADAACAIAYWGTALSLLNNPHSAPPAENLPVGLAALQKGKALGAKTERERDYIDALLVFYTDHDKVDHRSRVLAYLKAMEILAAKYPTDVEAQIAYAITLNVAASPADKTYANQLKGAAILEPIFARLPQHPGVAHYLIHLYDYPPIAAKGLEAARRYARIAPAAPHAQHMPSHIFTRVGAWADSVASNAASARAAKADKEWDDQMHAMDYMVYAYLQRGQDAEARAVVEEMATVTGWKRNGGFFAAAAAPARYAVERGDWKAAAALTVRPSAFPYTDALTHFARAMGAARTGDPAAAQADIDALARIAAKLSEAKDAYWSGQVDIQRQVATAWQFAAVGKHDEALTTMRAAVEAEDRTEKAPITPGPLAPARELQGDMLMQRGMAAEALAAYRATMAKEPNRFNGLSGAAKAAAAAGDKAAARGYYTALVALSAESVKRAEVAEAQRYIAAN